MEDFGICSIEPLGSTTRELIGYKWNKPQDCQAIWSRPRIELGAFSAGTIP